MFETVTSCKQGGLHRAVEVTETSEGCSTQFVGDRNRTRMEASHQAHLGNEGLWGGTRWETGHEEV